MSQPEDPFVVIDDEDDRNISSSSTRSPRESKLISLSQKGKSSGRRLASKSKSFSKTSSKSLINSFVPSKKQNNWISSSFGFGSCEDGPSKKNKSSKQTHPTTEGCSSQQNKVDENLWIDKYKPQSETELAVHKKKIEDVRSLVLDHLCSKSNAILLLTGPVGAGKTATIHALSKELGFEIQEWINPLIQTSLEGSSFGSERFTSRFAISQSQISQFQDFLLRSNKYPTLSIFGSSNEKSNIQRKIILIEDLPNIFYRDAKKFHEVLRSYKQTGRCPLILIISDSHQDDSNVYKLLPKTIHSNLGITTINFNPVAHTSLVKTLNRIVSLESKKAGKNFSLPPKDTINELAQSSAGDIRTAINALQFSCQRGVQDNVMSRYKSTSTASTSKKSAKGSTTQGTHVKQTKAQESQIKRSAGGVVYNKENKEDDQDTVKAIGGKDTTIFLFRALGKILYCKRDPSKSDKDLLPSNMSHLARNQPLFCPEEVVERAHLSSEMLTLYLHQNYLDFFTDIEDVVQASECLSDANMMSMEWMHRASLIPYMSCIITRGLMFYNGQAAGTSTSTSRGGFRPLHKPQWFEVNKKARVNCQTAKELFPDQTCPTTVLYTHILPYLAITDVPLKTPGQIAFIQQMGQYQKNKSTSRSFADTLDEKDCGGNAEDGEPRDLQSFSRHNSSEFKNENMASQTKAQETQKIEAEVTEIQPAEESIVIEDFDDDW